MTNATTYRSRRFPIAIDVTIAGETVRWAYRTLGNEWREQLPLTTLIPYPRTTICNTSVRLGTATIVFVPLTIALMIWLAGATTGSIAIGALLAAVGVVATTIAFRRGAIEWVTFNSFYPEKQIHFFRNAGDLDFDLFVERMQAAIEDSGGSCGIDGDAPDEIE